jgi:hypothetical protein
MHCPRFWMTSSLFLLFFFNLHAQAQCSLQSDSCVTNASGSGDIPGDQTGTGSTIVTVYMASGSTDLILDVAVADTAELGQFFCEGGLLQPGVCRWPNLGQGNHTVTVSYTGRNYTTSAQSEMITFNVYGFETHEAPQAVNFNVTPASPPYEPPAQNPDAPCPGCGKGGSPINFANGRVAQALDFVGITNAVGCPVLRGVCEGREPDCRPRVILILKNLGPAIPK